MYYYFKGMRSNHILRYCLQKKKQEKKEKKKKQKFTIQCGNKASLQMICGI